MVRRALKPSLRAASCCSVEVVKGGAGLRRRCLRSIASTRNSPPSAGPAAARMARSTSRAAVSLVKLNCSTFWPRYSSSFSGKDCELCAPSPSMVQYSCTTNAPISSSRSQIMRSAGLCTRPADSPRRTFFHSSGERLKPTR